MANDRKAGGENRFRPGKNAFLRRLNLRSRTNLLALFLLVAAIISGLATYGALTETPPFGNDPNTVIWLLNFDLIILLLLVTLIARRMVAVWSGRRRGIAGSRLHVRLVFIFSILAAAPAIIMTIFAAFFLHFGVQSWFSDRVRTAVVESQAVAEAYLQEHMNIIRADILAMANDLDRQASYYITNPESFHKIIQTQAMLRNFSEVSVFDSAGRILARAGIPYSFIYDSPSALSLQRAREGETVVIAGANNDRVKALVKLDAFNDTFLLVGRMVDPVVLSRVADTRRAAQEYERLEKQRSGLQIKITLIFIIVALLLLLAAIWFSLIFARQLVTPISALIAAADQVRAGDLTARVPELERRDEFDVLARAFNRMTSQIQEQRNELVTANRQLDERRRFTEAVLAGVSAGIIGIDKSDRITIANASAADLFGITASELTGMSVTAILPDLEALLRQAEEKPGKITQAEIPYIRDQVKRTLLVRIAVEMIDGQEQGAVLTFDDITELQSAQRKAAWADVARRVAHEIKNPLTPIQLSAERLKRKYLNQIDKDQEIFAQCTDTIIHHVGDIGRMVNEFSSFARMPEPVMSRENIMRHLQEMLVLQQQAHPSIRFALKTGSDVGDAVYSRVDAQQVRQAFTNILQNAIDSVAVRFDPDAGTEANDSDRGRIDVLLNLQETDGDRMLAVSVTDNGPGLPVDVDQARLTEPYVTRKERGTGLGLAIVKKIMEDHHGQLLLGVPEWLRSIPEWQDLGGATVILAIPCPDSDVGNEPASVERRTAVS